MLKSITWHALRLTKSWQYSSIINQSLSKTNLKFWYLSKILNFHSHHNWNLDGHKVKIFKNFKKSQNSELILVFVMVCLRQFSRSWGRLSRYTQTVKSQSLENYRDTLFASKLLFQVQVQSDWMHNSVKYIDQYE